LLSYLLACVRHKIGKSLNKRIVSLIKYYKNGLQKDWYKGYSTNYQDLDIDVYKTELRKLIKDILRLLDCNVQKLEDKIFLTDIEDDNNGYDMIISGTMYATIERRTNNRWVGRLLEVNFE
jgi:hypothetical protein